MINYDVTALGEMLIDFTPHGISESGMLLFEQNAGGAPANVAAAVSKLGGKSAMLGKVGNDMHGSFIIDKIKNCGVETNGIIKDKNVYTTLAFVSLSEKGERDFSFSRKPGADTCYCESELNLEILKSSYIFHFGSLSLTNEPARSTTLKALDIAKKSGSIISYDPNYRAPLWNSKEEAVFQIKSVLSKVDIIKISDEETFLLTEKADPYEAALYLINLGIKCVVVTLGKNGAMAVTKNACVNSKPPEVEIIDTTGAGDSFWGGFLFKISRDKKFPDLPDIVLKEYIEFSNAVASLCIGKRGAIPALPDFYKVSEFIEKIN